MAIGLGRHLPAAVISAYSSLKLENAGDGVPAFVNSATAR